MRPRSSAPQRGRKLARSSAARAGFTEEPLSLHPRLRSFTTARVGTECLHAEKSVIHVMFPRNSRTGARSSA